MKKNASRFLPLHCRSSFSLLRGVLSPETVCSWAAERGFPAVGMVDTGNFYGLVRFLAAARETGIRPVAGAEIVTGGRWLATAYCTDRTGYGRLCGILTRILSGSDPENAGYDPVADLQDGGWDGLVLVSPRRDVLRTLLQRQRHDLYAALLYGRPFRSLACWARERDVPPLALNAGFYRTERERRTGELLRAVDLHRPLDALPPEERPGEWRRLAGAEETSRFFSAIPEALTNTEALAEAAGGAELLPGRWIFPAFGGLDDGEAYGMLRRLCLEGVGRRYGTMRKPILDRLDYELSVIRRKGFSSYFLVVRDIVSRCPCTCGRGSSASSIVSYLLGITHVDPLAYDLFFERFLNGGRKDPPDIDVDFPWDERDRALAYVFETYRGRVGMVADHVTFGPRSSLREAAKAFGTGERETERLVRLWMREERAAVPPYLREAAEAIRGLPRYIGLHPGGVVITPGQITDHCHVQPSRTGRPVIAWEKDSAEAAGLVKIDLLGNRSLAVLRDTLDLVNPRRRAEGREPVEWERFDPLEDGPTREAVASGDTLGVFYVESPATRLLLRKMRSGDFPHLVAASSIIRPAANRCIREYLRRLRGEPYDTLHPLVEKTLRETLGIMVYQEDVARVAVAVAGFSPEQADSLRKVISKKDGTTRLDAYRERFFTGGLQRGVEWKALETLWEMVLSFEGYSFCKAHSASYAMVSYRLAYLKVRYPLEFFVSVINNGGGFYGTQVYLNAVRRLGFRILGPDVNASDLLCGIENGALRIGLSSVKALREQWVRDLLAERERGGPFAGFFDFIRRSGPDLAELRALIRSGSLDRAGAPWNRPRMFWAAFHALGSRRRESPAAGELFPDPGPPESIADYRPVTKLRDEKETLGMLISRHPIEIFRSRAKRLGTELRLPHVADSRALHRRPRAAISIAGTLAAGKEVRTRDAREMLFLSFEDEYGIFETVLFPDTYAACREELAEGAAFLVVGRVQDEFGAVTLEVERLIRLEGTSSPARISGRTEGGDSVLAHRKIDNRSAAPLY